MTGRYTMELPLVLNCDIPHDAVQEIKRFVQGLQSLAEAMSRSLAHEPPRLVKEIVHQDEYTLDVVIPVRHPWVLVLDAT